MGEIRTVSEENGVRTVTDGKSTWKEYQPFKRGVIGWFEDEVLSDPDTWYTKTLAFICNWLIFPWILIPIYQAVFVYFASQWVGLGGWEWWQILIKGIVLGFLWAIGFFINVWAGHTTIGENGAFGPDDI